MKDIYIRMNPKEKGKGVEMMIEACYDAGKNKQECKVVDKLFFDNKDVMMGRPQRFMNWMEKSIDGTYWEQGCKRLNLPIQKDGRCYDPELPKKKSSGKKKAPKKEAPKKKGSGLKTMTIKRRK